MRFLGCIFSCVLFFLLTPHITHANGLLRVPSNLGLIGYWPLNEGTSTTAQDYSGNRRNGAMNNFANPSTATSGWINGNLGKAIKFDGVDDYVNLGDVNDMRTGNLTVNFFFKTTSTADAGLVEKSSARSFLGRYFAMIDTGDLLACIDWTAVTGPCASTPIAPYADGKWHMYTAVYNRSGNLVLYVDLVQKAAIDISAGVAVDMNTTDPLYFGAYGNTTGTGPLAGFYFSGSLDDIRIFNRALSTSEMTTLYNTKVTARKTVSNNGLVGYWPMEEGAGTQVNDFSGNRNNGTINNSLILWKNGKLGSALQFDSSTQVGVAIPNSQFLNPTNAITVSAWIYPTSWPGNNRIIQKGSTDNQYRFTAEGGLLKFEVYTGSAKAVTTALPAVNKWTHVVGVYDSVNVKIYVDGNLMNSLASVDPIIATTDQLVIGCKLSAVCATNDGFNGKIDDVRIYNRALSADEVAALSRSSQIAAARPQTSLVSSGLVGYWPFGGNYMNWATGKALDASGNGNDGSITGMSTSTSPVQGRVGQALNFDNTDDKIIVQNSTSLNITGQITVSAWIYPRSFGGANLARIIDKSDTDGYLLLLNNTTGSKALYFLYGSSPVGVTYDNAITLNTWQHVLCTLSGLSVNCYLNGVSLGSYQFGSAPSSGSNASLGIGGKSSDNTRQFDGYIDEVRIYNRALSASEVLQLYNSSK